MEQQNDVAGVADCFVLGGGGFGAGFGGVGGGGDGDGEGSAGPAASETELGCVFRCDLCDFVDPERQVFDMAIQVLPQGFPLRQFLASAKDKKTRRKSMINSELQVLGSSKNVVNVSNPVFLFFRAKGRILNPRLAVDDQIRFGPFC